MPVLRFKAEEVRRVVEHSIAASKQSEEYVPHTTNPIAAGPARPRSARLSRVERQAARHRRR
jgi:hypothetical protein